MISYKKPNFFQFHSICVTKYVAFGKYSSFYQSRSANIEPYSVAFGVPIIWVSTRYSCIYTTNNTKL